MTIQMPGSGCQLFSTVTADGRLELSLQEVAVPTPADDEVIIRVEASPINPSDLGLLLGVADTSQLSVASYCDPRVLDLERRHLLSQGPGYVGHALMAPEPGDYHALAARDNAQALVPGHNGGELLTDTCRPLQRTTPTGKGNA